jgi:hypothetical protein
MIAGNEVRKLEARDAAAAPQNEVISLRDEGRPGSHFVTQPPTSEMSVAVMGELTSTMGLAK